EHGAAGGAVPVRAVHCRGHPVHGAAGGQARRRYSLTGQGGRDLLRCLGRRAALAVVGMGFSTGGGRPHCRKTPRTTAGNHLVCSHPSCLNCISRAQTGCSAHRCNLWSWFSSVRILFPQRLTCLTPIGPSLPPGPALPPFHGPPTASRS